MQKSGNCATAAAHRDAIPGMFRDKRGYRVRGNIVDDPLRRPGTTVLRNKAGLTDRDDLDRFMHPMFLARRGNLGGRAAGP